MPRAKQPPKPNNIRVRKHSGGGSRRERPPPRTPSPLTVVQFPMAVVRDPVMEAVIAGVALTCLLSEFANIYRFELRAYPVDAIMLLSLALLRPTLLGMHQAVAPLAAKSTAVAVLRSVVLVVLALVALLLCVRVSVRYDFVIALVVVLCSVSWHALWHFIGGQEVTVDVAVRYLPWTLLSAAVIRGVNVGVMVAFLPWQTVLDEHTHHDLWPTMVVSTLGAVAAMCLDVSSIMVVRKDKDARADSEGFLVRQQAAGGEDDVTAYLLVRSPYWVMLLPSVAAAVGSPAVDGSLSPAEAPLWAPGTAYEDQSVVVLDATNGGLDTRLYYRAVGTSPAGYHPRSLRSRVLQVLFTEPVRVVRTATIMEVILVGIVGELVLLQQRWGLYLGVMMALFAGLVATYVRVYLVMERHDEALRAAQRAATPPTPPHQQQHHSQESMVH